MKHQVLLPVSKLGKRHHYSNKQQAGVFNWYTAAEKFYKLEIGQTKTPNSQGESRKTLTYNSVTGFTNRQYENYDKNQKYFQQLSY